jgi:hypothetical protein
VEFFQAGTLGLLAAHYTDTKDEYMSADCLIDGTHARQPKLASTA